MSLYMSMARIGLSMGRKAEMEVEKENPNVSKSVKQNANEMAAATVAQIVCMRVLKVRELQCRTLMADWSWERYG